MRNVWNTLALTAVMGLVSCVSTTLESSWKDPNFAGGTFEKVAVIVFGKEQAATRKAEELLAGSLGHGTQGLAGYTLLTPAEAADPEQVKAKLRGAGCDGAVVCRVVSVDRSVEYVPGAWDAVPVGYRSFGGYYGAGYTQVSGPGYVDETVTVRVETNVYDIATEQLVWSGVTETFEPGTREKLVESNAGVIVAELRKLGLIASPPKSR